MKSEKTKLEHFNFKNLPLIVDVVFPLWSPPVGDDDFKRFNVEYIVRNNIAENEYRFQLVKESEKDAASKNHDDFLSAAFFARKGDKSKAHEWFEKESARFSDDLKSASGMSRTYLTLMDKRTLSFMNDDDIKLSLFVSRKPGAGSLIFDRMCEKLRTEGWKNIYLWTDCDCNWKWYEKHGFTLVQKGTYEPFSSEHEDYKTFIFKRAL